MLERNDLRSRPRWLRFPFQGRAKGVPRVRAGASPAAEPRWLVPFVFACLFLLCLLPLISLAKGLERDTMLRMTQVIQDVIPDHLAGALTGPNLAREIMAGYAAASVIAIDEERVARQVQRVFHSGLFRVYTNHDVIGCELGGALKNVIAIAAGASDGMGFGHNARAALITRGVAEVARLVVKLGGEPLTVAGLAGMGDLVLTCTGELSRNRHVGFELGRGKKLVEILGGMRQVAEGVRTARSAYDLGQREGVLMPIANEVYAVLYQDKDPRVAVYDLMVREAHREFHLD